MEPLHTKKKKEWKEDRKEKEQKKLWNKVVKVAKENGVSVSPWELNNRVNCKQEWRFWRKEWKVVRTTFHEDNNHWTEMIIPLHSTPLQALKDLFDPE